MTAIRWSPQAADDLEAIRAYIARNSPHYAHLAVQRIAASIELLADNPRMGRVVPELRDPEVREVMAGPYRVVYRHRHDTTEIVTIFHGARLFRW